MPASRWTAEPYSFAAADAVARELGLSSPTAAILTRRGYDTPAAAQQFLAADERHDPFAFEDMGVVCDLVLAHVENGSRIVVHGDYDVDGICSTAILVRALRALGADPGWHIPSRDDGYGLSLATVERLADRGTGLLITADCAITAAAEVDAAIARGMDVVVTDHHRPGERLPDCPIVHPALSGYPFPDLCAAGVAYKLACALFAAAGRDSAELEDELDLIALATIADVVPLRGENRRLVREGMVALARTRRPGLRALMRVARIEPSAVDERGVGFGLAPRLNAAGRIQRADAALELVLTDDEERAAQVADELDILNRERRDTETRILFEAEAARAEHPDAPAYVLAGEGWHPGVIGIVASRLVERHNRPVVVIALDGDSGRGSGRSIGPFDLHAGLAAASDHLRRFGGHRAAAGLEIDRSEVDAFRAAFIEYAASVLAPEDLVPVERVDAVVSGDALGIGLAEELERLRPFGHGNPTPTLLVPAARVSDVRPMGDDGQHSRFTLVGGGGSARAVAFRTAARLLPATADDRNDAAVRLELNEWNGTVEPRVLLRALCPSEPGDARPAVEPPFWDAFWRAYDEPLPEPVPGPALRELRDHRGRGFAGVCGDLMSSGESVLVVCADGPRRRAGLAAVLGGVGVPVAFASWDDVVFEPALAERYAHVVVLDPPSWPRGADWLAGLGPSGFVHLAWGPAEVDFSLAVAERRLDPRDELVLLYRALRAGGGVEAALRDGGRSPQQAARLVRILDEAGLAQVRREDAGLGIELMRVGRTGLTKSALYRALLERLDVARRELRRDVPRAA